MSTIFPAATVVLIRDSAQGLEVLLLERSRALSFASGAWVFPGGRIDSADYREDPHNIEAAARRGAVRETLEETQLDIGAHELLYFAHWITPPENPKRFATWFFIAALGAADNEVVVDGSEIVAHRWCRPEQALAEQRAKKMAMMPPTFITLTELSACATVAEALALYRQRPLPEYAPKFTSTEKGVAMLYAGDAGYSTAEQDAVGPRHRCWLLDDAWHFEKKQ